MLEQIVKRGEPHPGPDVPGEPVRDGPRRLARRGFFRQQRMPGMARLEILDDRERVLEDALAVTQHRHGLLPEAQQLRNVRSRQQVVDPIRQILVVQRPADDLRIHREIELPQLDHGSRPTGSTR